MRRQNVGSSEAPARRPIIRRWFRNWGGVALAVSAALIALSIYTNLRDIGKPFPGFMSFGFVGERPATIFAETPDWWPVLANGLLTPQDRLVTIDQLPYTVNARGAVARAYEDDRDVSILVRRFDTGEERTVVVRPELLTWASFLDFKLPEALVAGAFWLLALLVLRAQPEAITNQVFTVTAASVAIHRALVVPSVMTDGYHWPLPVLIVGHLIAAGLIGPLLVHLATVFPRPTSRRMPRLLGSLYVLGLASGVILSATRLPPWGSVPLDISLAVDQASYATMLSLLLLGVVALFGRLTWLWLRERRNRRQRRAAVMILVGLLGSLPAVIILLLPLVMGLEQGPDSYWNGLDLRYLLLSIPITFAYVIIRYQTFQALSSLFIFVLVLSSSGVLAAIGAWLWRLSVPADLAALRPPFALLFGFIFLGSLMWSAQVRRARWFGRSFQWEAATYDAARSFGRRVIGTGDARELPGVVTQALVDEMALERAALWLRQTDGAFALAGRAGDTNTLPPRLDAPGGDEWFPRRVLRSHRPEGVPDWLQPLAGDGKMEIVIPLAVEGEPMGLLGLGRRWDEAIFDERDIAVAELVGQQATLLLQTSLQLEQLRRVPIQVAAAQERERLRVAGELHDTIQQFLGRLPFFLAASRDRMRDDPQGASDLIERCLTDVEDAAATLRSIRVSLAPNRLQTDLRRSLEGLVSHVQTRSGLAITLSVPDNLDEALDAETRHALYRVIQQALDNAVAHAEATTARVWLGRDNGRVLFRVQDDGRGSSPEQRLLAQSDGSFGLKSMQARLEMCGGSFDFDSHPGTGTTVAGWVPSTL